MAFMLSGLQVECGECDKPSTTTVDEQVNKTNVTLEPTTVDSTVDGQADEIIPTIADGQVFTMTCTTCGVTNTVNSDEAAEALST